MSQYNQNQPSSDSQENSGRNNEGRDRKRYEGFEGMNYEQRRQPFETANSGNRNGDDNSNSNGSNQQDNY